MNEFVGIFFESVRLMLEGPHPTGAAWFIGFWFLLFAVFIYGFVYQIPKAYYWDYPNSRYGKMIRAVLWPFLGQRLIPEPKSVGAVHITKGKELLRVSGRGCKTIALDDDQFVIVYWSDDKLRIGISDKCDKITILTKSKVI